MLIIQAGEYAKLQLHNYFQKHQGKTLRDQSRSLSIIAIVRSGSGGLVIDLFDLLKASLKLEHFRSNVG